MSSKTNKDEKKTKNALKIQQPLSVPSSEKGKKTAIKISTPLGKIKLSPRVPDALPDALKEHVEQIPQYVDMIKKLKEAVEKKNVFAVLALLQEFSTQTNCLTLLKKDSLFKEVQEMLETKGTGALNLIKQIMSSPQGETNKNNRKD